MLSRKVMLFATVPVNSGTLQVRQRLQFTIKFESSEIKIFNVLKGSHFTWLEHQTLHPGWHKTASDGKYPPQFRVACFDWFRLATLEVIHQLLCCKSVFALRMWYYKDLSMLILISGLNAIAVKKVLHFSKVTVAWTKNIRWKTNVRI